ncbi:MAG: hypothetical protein H6817_08880 [Phycisphaerales bacterium]|nr:hypothetical protein [Phycisphaerales bacterium]
MIFVQSYMFMDDRLVPVHEWWGPVVDQRYIAGALELHINRVALLTTEMDDLIDQLWGYIISGLDEHVVNGREFRTLFPDQPIELCLSPSSDGKSIHASVDCNGIRSAVVGWSEFFDAILSAGELFFRQLIVIAPGCKPWHKETAALIPRIRTMARLR